MKVFLEEPTYSNVITPMIRQFLSGRFAFVGDRKIERKYFIAKDIHRIQYPGNSHENSSFMETIYFEVRFHKILSAVLGHIYFKIWVNYFHNRLHENS